MSIAALRGKRRGAAMTDSGDMFSRWSRRKRAVAEEEARAIEPVAEPAPEAIAEPEGEGEEAALLQRLNLPRPETMKAGDDFSVFMKAGVPEFLKKRALRVLWRSNPVLACVDGLNDYDEDFTSPELTQKVLATAYKVGKGIVFDPPEDEDVEEAVEEDVDVDPSESAVPLDDSQPASYPAEDAAQRVAETEVGEDAQMCFRPRRMRFET